MAWATLLLTGLAFLVAGAPLLLGIGMPAVAALLIFHLTWLLEAMHRNRTKTIVKLVGGPNHGELATAYSGSVTCVHGYVLSSLCDNCACTPYVWLPESSSMWYTVVGDLAVYTPQAEAHLPDLPGRIVDARLAAACNILKHVVNDAATGSIAAELMKLATTLIRQEVQGPQFDAAVRGLLQRAVAAVSTSATVTAAREVALMSTQAESALIGPEREQVIAAAKTLDSVQHTLAVYAPRLRTLPQTLVHIRQELQIALDTKPMQGAASEPEDLSSPQVLLELEILDSGIASITTPVDLH